LKTVTLKKKKENQEPIQLGKQRKHVLSTEKKRKKENQEQIFCI
jgi:hypothetical protein